ncbi:MAG: DUF1573 domain-containing protein [Bacteroidetes bacterium]|nr:DUF1573 domain-containing protein [Bacteroidota bacterium]
MDRTMQRCGLLLTFAFLLLSSAAAQPAVKLSGILFDLGPIFHGDVKQVPLVITNTGDQPLRILGVETSCGCTSAKQPAEFIAPGASDSVIISFNSLGFSGRITKIVTIRTNDPRQPYSEARITGTVTSVLETVPPMQVVNFGGSPVGTTTTVDITFRNTLDEPVTITRIAVPDTAVRTAFTAAEVAPGAVVSIPFTFTPANRTFTENYLYIHTSDPRQPKLPVRYMYLGR